MNATDTLKSQKNDLINKYAKRSNIKAFIQTLTTVIPYFVLFYLAIESLAISYWLTLGISTILVLFVLRVFVMLHDCGHGCLYEKPGANKAVGFFMGILCGVPQYVWSKHHDYHHSTNGNWNKYRGPLSVLSTDQYSELTDKAKKSYANNRNILIAPIGGFLYFIFNPRFTWLKGSLQLALSIVSGKIKNRNKSFTELANEFETGYWKTWQEYRHMTANNIVLLTCRFFAASYFGAIEFFVVYIAALSFAGGIGIILFTVQHNFEESYATGDEEWDYFTAALEGTSFLILPKWLHWFTADIGYHHIHHLSARIPNYNLAKCHNEYSHLFDRVTRIKLSGIPHAFKFILWDNHTNKIISVAQYEEAYGQSAETESTKQLPVDSLPSSK